MTATMPTATPSRPFVSDPDYLTVAINSFFGTATVRLGSDGPFLPPSWRAWVASNIRQGDAAGMHSIRLRRRSVVVTSRGGPTAAARAAKKAAQEVCPLPFAPLVRAPSSTAPRRTARWMIQANQLPGSLTDNPHASTEAIIRTLTPPRGSVVRILASSRHGVRSDVVVDLWRTCRSGRHLARLASEFEVAFTLAAHRYAGLIPG